MSRMESPQKPEIQIRDASIRDAGEIAAIYNHYIMNSVVTFEEDEVTTEEMAGRIGEVQSAGLPWLTATHNGSISGYAYATKWRTRKAYRFSVEVTVYVDPGCERLGIGSRLYKELLTRVKDDGFHAAMAGIVLPNEASVALHEKMGFSKVAHFKEAGYKFGNWLDVGYWQRIL